MTTETLNYMKEKVLKAEENRAKVRRIERLFRTLGMMAPGKITINLSVVRTDGCISHEIGNIVFDGASAEKVLALIEEEKQLLREEYELL